MALTAQPPVLPASGATGVGSPVWNYWHQQQAAKLAQDKAKFIAASHPVTAPAPAGPKPGAPTSIGAAQQAGFNNERAAADNTYRLGLANNTSQQGLANNSFTQQLQQMIQQAGKDRAQTDFNYNGRGLLSSGIYHQGLSDLLGAQLQQQGGVHQQQALSQGMFHTQAQQLLAQHADALANIEAQRQAAIAQISNGSIG